MGRIIGGDAQSTQYDNANSTGPEGHNHDGMNSRFIGVWEKANVTLGANYFSGTAPTLNCYDMKTGKTAHLLVNVTGGTSNSTGSWYLDGLRWPLASQHANHRQVMMVVNGGTAAFGQGYIIGGTSRTRLYFFPSASGGGAQWTASGLKECSEQIFSYPVD